MDAIDWLQQQDLAAWRTRLRQLRYELNQERGSRGAREPGRTEESPEASPPSHFEAQKPQSVPQEVAPPAEWGRPQKPARSTLSSRRSD